MTDTSNFANQTHSISLFGCGALGSWIATMIARPRFAFMLFDDDIVAEHNLENSAFEISQVGQTKINALAYLLWRKSKTHSLPFENRITASNISEVKAATVNYNFGIDTFDNMQSRQLLTNMGYPVLHVGVSIDRLGAITWSDVVAGNENPNRQTNPVCTRDIGAPIIRVTAAVAVNIAMNYLTTGEKRSVVLDMFGSKI